MGRIDLDGASEARMILSSAMNHVRGQTSITIPAWLKSALDERGLVNFDDFLNYAEDAAVSRRGKRPVRPLKLQLNGKEEGFYLKQFRLTLRFLFTEIWKRRLPVLAGSRRELEIIRLLEKHQVPVMSPAAWGERRRFGLPVAGFLLVRAVVGEPLVERYARASGAVRRRLRRLHGSLIGTLHKHGILTKVRPRDLMLVSEPAGDFRQSLVVIDRERGLTMPVAMSTKQRATQLADVWCKSGTELGLGTRGELQAFLAGYFRAAETPASERRELESCMQEAGLGFIGRDTTAIHRFEGLWRPLGPLSLGPVNNGRYDMKLITTLRRFQIWGNPNSGPG